MNAKVFIDTNIFVSCVDKAELGKQKQARRIVTDLVESSLAVTSAQVMQEFYVTLSRKLKLEEIKAKRLMSLLRNIEISMVDEKTVLSAIDSSILNQISFWDGLIISAAEKAKCDYLYTEDLNDAQIIQGVKIVNPFTI